MNPSTKDILDAFENLPTDKIIILPNNKNIILAAQQAKEVTVKKVYIIPSHNIPQGLAAMMHLNPDGDVEAVAARMDKSIEDVIAIEITTATTNGGDRWRIGGTGTGDCACEWQTGRLDGVCGKNPAWERWKKPELPSAN